MHRHRAQESRLWPKVKYPANPSQGTAPLGQWLRKRITLRLHLIKTPNAALSSWCRGILRPNGRYLLELDQWLLSAAKSTCRVPNLKNDCSVGSLLPFAVGYCDWRLRLPKP